jgi:biopolymer transport protein ExbB/TolQ
MLERSMVAFALLGAEWVLYLLVILSVISVAIMIERAVFFAKRRVDVKGLAEELGALLDKTDVDGATRLLDARDGMESHVVATGLRSVRLGGAAVRDLMAGELVRQRTRFEARLIFLGTLGNNAPFIGLFGTVLGIIKAFRDLSLADPGAAATGGNASVVMAGISEALVATAVGLAVALPAVVAFNYFKSLVKNAISNTETLSKTLTARLDRLAPADAKER